MWLSIRDVFWKARDGYFCVLHVEIFDEDICKNDIIKIISKIYNVLYEVKDSQFKSLVHSQFKVKNVNIKSEATCLTAFTPSSTKQGRILSNMSQTILILKANTIWDSLILWSWQFVNVFQKQFYQFITYLECINEKYSILFCKKITKTKRYTKSREKKATDELTSHNVSNSGLNIRSEVDWVCKIEHGLIWSRWRALGRFDGLILYLFIIKIY